MTSQIDPTLPVEGTPTTASVRSNFQTAHDEITALQADVADLTASEVAISPAIGTLGANVQTGLSTLNTTKAPINSPQFTGEPTTPTPNPSDVSTTVSNTQFVATAAAPGAHSIGKNYIDNALCSIWQRGYGPFIAQGMTMDRWQLAFNLDTGVSVSHGLASDAMRTGINDEQWGHYMSVGFTGNAGTASYTEIIHKIEGVRRLTGKTVTLSFYAWCSTGALKIYVGGANIYGTGGSGADIWSIPNNTLQLSTQVTRYSLTWTLPSASGKTVGNNGDDCLQIQIFVSSGGAQTGGNPFVQAGTINFWGFQLELGSVMTPLEKLVPADDWARCARFLQSVQVGALVSCPSAGNFVSSYIGFPVFMRLAPTLVSSTVIGTDTNITAGSVAINYMSATGVQPFGTSVGAGQANWLRTMLFTAEL